LLGAYRHCFRESQEQSVEQGEAIDSGYAADETPSPSKPAADELSERLTDEQDSANDHEASSSSKSRDKPSPQRKRHDVKDPETGKRKRVWMTAEEWEEHSRKRNLRRKRPRLRNPETGKEMTAEEQKEHRREQFRRADKKRRQRKEEQTKAQASPAQ
jgi:hypothetical protein